MPSQAKYTSSNPRKIECEKYIHYYDRLFDYAKRGDYAELAKLVNEVTQNTLTHALGAFPEYLLASLLICVKDEHGKTAWDYVVSNQHQEILDELYKDYERPTYDEWTSFVGAAWFNQTELVKSALKKHPEYLNRRMDVFIFKPLDENLTAVERCPTLMQAAVHNNYPAMVRVLKSFGLTTELTAQQKQAGMEPFLDFAIKQGYTELSEALQETIAIEHSPSKNAGEAISYYNMKSFLPTLFAPSWDDSSDNAKTPEPKKASFCSII